MSDSINLELYGADEILAAFRELNYKTQHKRLHQVLSDAAKIPKKAMRSEIKRRKTKLKPPIIGGAKWHPPGLGKKSVYQKRGRSKRSAVLFVGIKTRTGDYKTDAYYLRIWDLYNPGAKKIVTARDASIIPTQNNIVNSMKTIIERTWKKYAKT